MTEFDRAIRRAPRRPVHRPRPYLERFGILWLILLVGFIASALLIGALT